MTPREYYLEVLNKLKDRLDTCLDTTMDNPIYEDKNSRSIHEYILCIKEVQELLRKEVK